MGIFSFLERSVKIRKYFIFKALKKSSYFFDVLEQNNVDAISTGSQTFRTAPPKRCLLTGRRAGLVGLLGFSRLKSKQLAERAVVPGVVRLSW